MRRFLTRGLLRHIGKPLKNKIPKQASPPIPKKNFISRHKSTFGGAGLLAAGGLAEPLASRAFGKQKHAQDNKNEGAINVFVKKNYISNTQNLRRG